MSELKEMQAPTDWADKYTSDDKDKVRRVIEYLNESGRDQKWLSNCINLSSPSVNQVLRGKYPSPVSEILDSMLEAISLNKERHKRRHADAFAETSVYRLINASCHRARVYRSFAVISGAIGAGKSFGLRQYASKHKRNTFIVECLPGMTAGVLIRKIMKALRIQVKGTLDAQVDAIVDELIGTDSLLILDEAEKCTLPTLEYIRRISDAAKVGVVLVGNRALEARIKPARHKNINDSLHGQISSRVGFWAPYIESITEDDCTAIVQTSMAHDDVELTPEILDAFWQACQGSARMLGYQLIPTVRDYGLMQNKPLSPALIFKVAQDVLRLTV